jgi:phosphatidate cytidylyltransferase
MSGPPQEALLVLGGLAVTLVVATGVGGWVERRSPGEASANLNARIRAWWVMIGISGAALVAGSGALTALFALAALLVMREYATAMPPRAGEHAGLAIAFYLLLPGQIALAVMGMPWLGLLLGLFYPAALRFGAVFCVGGLLHIPALLQLEGQRGQLLVVFLVLIVQASDVLQYIWGKLAGRRPIAPRLSPSKTVEGFAGGMASAAVLGGAVWWLTPLSPAAAGGVALAVALAGFGGGLAMSAVKRRRGIKDWGRMVAGHGGVLDRVDSLCLAAPLLYYGIRWWGAAGGG